MLDTILELLKPVLQEVQIRYRGGQIQIFDEIGHWIVFFKGKELEEPITAKIWVIFHLSNIGKKKGIAKILLEETEWPLAVTVFDRGTGKELNSFTLQNEEVKLIELRVDPAPTSNAVNETKGKIRIYGSRGQVIKEKEVKIYVGKRLFEGKESEASW